MPIATDDHDVAELNEFRVMAAAIEEALTAVNLENKTKNKGKRRKKKRCQDFMGMVARTVGRAEYRQNPRHLKP